MVALLVSPGVARAQVAAPCAPGETACGRAAFSKGVTAAEKENWSVAALAFESALQVERHPSVLLNLAIALNRLGQPVRAERLLDEVLADPSIDTATSRSAALERADAQGRIAFIRLAAPATEGISFMVDGRPVVGDAQEAAVDPGTHTVSVTKGGRVLVDKSLSVEPGERVTLSVDLSREVLLLEPPAGPATKRPATAPETSDSDPGAVVQDLGISPTWFYVIGGSTIALAGLATWSSLATRSAAASYDERLDAGDFDGNPALENDVLGEGHALERRSNWLWAGTGLLAASSVVVGALLVNWQPRPSRTATIDFSLSPDSRTGTLYVSGKF